MIRSVKLAFLAVVMLAVAAPPAESSPANAAIENPYGAEVSGRVASIDGTSLPDALVRISGRSTSVLAGKDGRFLLPGLPMGVYTIEVEAEGFTSERRVDVEVLPGQTVDLEITLYPRVATWPREDPNWSRVSAVSAKTSPLHELSAEDGRNYGVQAIYLSDGDTEYVVEGDAFHRLQLRAIAHPAPKLSFSVTADLAFDKFSPRVGSTVDQVFTGNTDFGSSLRESQDLRANLNYSLAQNMEGWLDLGWENTVTKRYSHLWSRPGYVQVFQDTTRNGDIELRHGDYSEVQLGEDYLRWNPSDHLPESDFRKWSGAAGFDHRIDNRSRYSFRAGFTRAKFDERVGDKKAWQYEGDRRSDFWFDYANRGLEDFFVIAGDFPRLAWGDSNELSLSGTYSRGHGQSLLDLGGSYSRRSQSYNEVVYPFLTNIDGEIGRRVNFDEAHPHYTMFASQRLGTPEVGGRVGLALDAFHLNEALPIAMDDVELQRQWSSSIEVYFEPFENAGRVSYEATRGYRLPTASYQWYRERVTLPYSQPDPLEGSTEAETFRRHSLTYGLNHSFGSARVSGTSENLDGRINGDGTVSSLIEARSLELEFNSPPRFRLGGSVRYRLAESEDIGDGLYFRDVQVAPGVDVPTDWDVRHRVELKAHLRNWRTWSAAVFWQYESGKPYTEYRRDGGRGEFNDERLPFTQTVDVTLRKQIRDLSPKVELFAEVFNLLNRKNVADLSPSLPLVPPGEVSESYDIYYAETGELGGGYFGDDVDGDSKSDFVGVNDPRVFEDPRSIRLGIVVGF